MGGKGRKKKGPNVMPGSQHVSMTLREESRGKKQGNVNAKTMCKLDHLKNLAVWAAVEASIPPLGAFFGERLAATTQALDIRADLSFFVCERCETLMQPGLNCTVRIEKNRSKVRHRHKKLNLTTQNNVVYKCHFCSHQNVMRGTPKGYVKEICPVKPRQILKLKIVETVVKNPPVNKVDFVALSPLPEQNPEMSSPATPRQNIETSSPATPEQNLETSSPAMPLPVTGLSLLDSKRRKRKRSGAKKVAEPETIVEAEKSIHASSKRKKKSWTSLKEIAEGGGQVGNKVTSLAVPFFI